MAPGSACLTPVDDNNGCEPAGAGPDTHQLRRRSLSSLERLEGEEGRPLHSSPSSLRSGGVEKSGGNDASGGHQAALPGSIPAECQDCDLRVAVREEAQAELNDPQPAAASNPNVLEGSAIITLSSTTSLQTSASSRHTSCSSVSPHLVKREHAAEEPDCNAPLLPDGSAIPPAPGPAAVTPRLYIHKRPAPRARRRKSDAPFRLTAHQNAFPNVTAPGPPVEAHLSAGQACHRTSQNSAPPAAPQEALPNDVDGVTVEDSQPAKPSNLQDPVLGSGELRGAERSGDSRGAEDPGELRGAEGSGDLRGAEDPRDLRGAEEGHPVEPLATAGHSSPVVNTVPDAAEPKQAKASSNGQRGETKPHGENVAAAAVAEQQLILMTGGQLRAEGPTMPLPDTGIQGAGTVSLTVPGIWQLMFEVLGGAARSQAGHPPAPGVNKASGATSPLCMKPSGEEGSVCERGARLPKLFIFNKLPGRCSAYRYCYLLLVVVNWRFLFYNLNRRH